MTQPGDKRARDEAQRAAMRARRAVRDRVTSVATVSAVLVIVGLIALPVAIDNWTPTQGPAPQAALGPEELSADSAESLRSVTKILAPGIGARTPNATEMAERLGDLGPSAIPVVVAMLCGHVPAPEFAAGTLDQPIHPLAIAGAQPAMFASIAHFRPKDVVAHLRLCAPDATYDDRLLFARLLGEVGTLDAQSALIELLALIEPIDLTRDRLANMFEDALTRCIKNEAGALKQLSKSLAKLPGASLPFVARAVGRTRGPHSAALLALMLGKSPDLDVVALVELARVTESSGIALNETALASVRRLLDKPDPKLSRAALTVAGRLCDSEAFGAILLRLEDPDRLIAAAAHWSLRNMAKVDLGLRSDAWLTWHAEQQTWKAERYAELCEKLGSQDSAEVFAALSELSLRPFFKHDIAQAIGPLVPDSEMALALTAIAALQRIGSTRAAPWLIEALQSDDERQAAASRALRSLTGLDLALDHEAWSTALSAAL